MPYAQKIPRAHGHIARHGIDFAGAGSNAAGYSVCIDDIARGEGSAQRIGGQDFDYIAVEYAVALFKYHAPVRIRFHHAHERGILQICARIRRVALHFAEIEAGCIGTMAGGVQFALQKRKELAAIGFALSDLLITVVRKPDGEGHAVLTVRTADGDFILDNLDDTVRAWYETPYTFLKRQAEFNTGRWVTIENGRDLLVGALR